MNEEEQHYHVAHYDEEGNLTDECDKCGKDLRDEVHYRDRQSRKVKADQARRDLGAV